MCCHTTAASRLFLSLPLFPLALFTFLLSLSSRGGGGVGDVMSDLTSFALPGPNQVDKGLPACARLARALACILPTPRAGGERLGVLPSKTRARTSSAAPCMSSAILARVKREEGPF